MEEREKNSASDTAYLTTDYLNISAQNKIMYLHYNIIWISSSKRAQETAQHQNGKLLIWL